MEWYLVLKVLTDPIILDRFKGNPKLHNSFMTIFKIKYQTIGIDI